ncbi:hypothetical protein [Streptomyces sp. NPDC026666]|uniref:hypothetical protein n=1 Tax=Streptomyces sp. NPDC026666 TaxID=3154799 RepID=UPI00345594CE
MDVPRAARFVIDGHHQAEARWGEPGLGGPPHGCRPRLAALRVAALRVAGILIWSAR